MDLESLTDDDLRKEMIKYGLNLCPITKTTKKIVINKLKSIIAGETKKHENTCENNNSVIETQKIDTTCDQNDVSSDESFYGVYKSGNESTPTVVKSFKRAITLLKSSPGSRFRAFKSYEDAEYFSKSPQVSSFLDSSLNSTKEPDPTNKYPSINTRELIRLKSLISEGKLNEIKNLIESNPKYLLRSCDIPTILVEGFHRNALHVATFLNKPQIVQYILSAIKNIFWISKFYSFDDPCEGIAFEKSQRLLDCFLNTPDKASFETPLHIACKYGFTDIARILLNEPLTNRDFKNSFGEAPLTNICSRCTNDEIDMIKFEIKSLFQKNCFVVITAESDTINAACAMHYLTSLTDITAIMGPTTTLIGEKIKRSINKLSSNMEQNKYFR
ncbi:hypothetical protein HZS_7726 [Henneguya salminicola]|nr:hypothetical protein HZS_7726 [Henneguya salminicola]